MRTPEEEKRRQEEVSADGAASPRSPDAVHQAAIGATLDGNSEEAKVLASAASNSPALDHTVDRADTDSAPSGPVSVNQYPVKDWDRYEFLKLLGQGGMGAVYKARDCRLGRIVALKFIRGGDSEMNQRFLQEARAQSRIDHPNICKVFDVGEIDGKSYIVMQFIEGLSLQQVSKQLTVIEKVQVIKTVAEALHFTHDLGIIHRDIKPANIMIERVIGADGVVRNQPVIMDFGLAREASEGKGLTESGAVMGTPSYMSPEQARGDVRRLDRRTDVYSLGATLYDLLSGAPPFEDESVVNIILKVLSDDVRPLRQKLPDLPLALDTIVCKCLNKEAEQRFPTAQALAEDLGRFLNNQRIAAKKASLLYRLRYRARRNKPVAALLAALLLGGCVFFAYGTRTYLQNRQQKREAQRKEIEAQLREKLAKQLGQKVKDMEWLIRVSYGMALHDTTSEKNLLRANLAEVVSDLGTYGQLARGMGPYVLGRGHLALHEWDKAYTYLQQAEAEGFTDLELDYALGRVLGALYMKKLDEARKSGDKSFVEKRKEELRVQFLVPALARLHRSQSLTTVSTKYVEALLDYYREYYDAALLNAHMALQQQPWLYEAKQLEGDVFAARALQQKEQGDPEQAERSYLEAIHRYGQAAENGRSDHTIYEAIAESWIRQEEMDTYRGRDPRLKREHALRAADQALEAAPEESDGWAKKAWAYFFEVYFLTFQQETAQLKETSTRLLDVAKLALNSQPEDPYVLDLLGNTYIILSSQLNGKSKIPYLDNAKFYLKKAIDFNPRFAWAYNDLGRAYAENSDSSLLTNTETESELKAAVLAYTNAMIIDPNFANGLTSLSAAYQALAELAAESGRDPSAYVQLCIDAAKKSLAITKARPGPFGNMALAHLRQALYKIDKGDDASSALLLAEENIKQLISINPNISPSYAQLATIYYLRAKWTEQNQANHNQFIQIGTEAAKKCFGLDSQNVICHAINSLLMTASAARHDTLSASLFYQKAVKDADFVNAHADGAREMISAALVYCAVAEFKVTHQMPASSEIKSGTMILKRLLETTQNYPRALAMLGELAVLDNRQQKDQQQRTSSLVAAQRYFQQAFAMNPLLRNRYGSWAAEAEQGLLSPSSP